MLAPVFPVQEPLPPVWGAVPKPPDRLPGDPDQEPTPAREQVLEGFDCHGLEDLGRATLMRRFDTKYLLPAAFLPKLLDELRGEYSALEIDGCRVFRYRNLYLDTPDFGFFRAHHNGKLNRHKVRHREYVEAGNGFLEVKFKDNRNRTVKTRMPWAAPWAPSPEGNRFLTHALGVGSEALSPVLRVEYRRISLANVGRAERVTLDLGLLFRPTGEAAGTRLDFLLVAELKEAGRHPASRFRQVMRQYRFRPGPFSKYCTGCCLVHPRSLRTNRFKPILRRVGNLHPERGSGYA